MVKRYLPLQNLMMSFEIFYIRVTEIHPRWDLNYQRDGSDVNHMI